MVGGAGETWSDAVILFEDKYENLSEDNYENLSEDKYENLSEDKYEKDRIEMQQERSSYAVPPPWVGKSGTGKKGPGKSATGWRDDNVLIQTSSNYLSIVTNKHDVWKWDFLFFFLL